MDDGNPDICLGRGFYPNNGHLTVIASDPEKDQGNVLVVNVSSSPGPLDTGHTLKKGDHKWITHESYIRCDRAVTTTVAALQEQVKKGEIRLTHCMAPGPLQKIHSALGASRIVPLEKKALLKDQGLLAE